MNCNFKFDTNEVTKALAAEVGSNGTLFTSSLLKATIGTEFNDKFKTWCKDTLGLDVKMNANADNAKKIAKAILDYYSRADINKTTRKKDSNTVIGQFGYSSDNARKMLIKDIEGAIKDIIYKNKQNDKEVKSGRETYYTQVAYTYMRNNVAKRAAAISGIDIKELLNQIKLKGSAAVETYFENASIQDKNVFAVFKEALSDPNFYTNLFNHGDLAQFKLADDQDIDDARLEETMFDDNLEASDDSTSDSVTDEVDTYMKDVVEKSTLQKNFMNFLDEDIKYYLSSLREITGRSTGVDANGKKIYPENKDNEIGIAKRMDPTKCTVFVHAYGDFTNRKTMIDSFRRIADNIPGFGAFYKLADDAEANYDFAYKLYSTFGRSVMTKLQSTIEGDKVESRISNLMSNKVESLKFEFYNSLRTTSILYDDMQSLQAADPAFKAVNVYLTFTDPTNKAVAAVAAKNPTQVNIYKLNAINELYKQLKLYYPTIEESTIANYVNGAHNSDVANNLKRLKTILENTIKSSYKTQSSYNSKLEKIRDAKRHNWSVKHKNEDGNYNARDLKDLEEIYKVDYVDQSAQSAAFELAKELVDYSTVKIELNSYSVDGNQSSDIINNSMLTNIMHTLQSETSLKNFGKYKFQSRQYDFSNIMVEHIDEKNNIINYGLFTRNEETGELTPTEYAQELLKVALYNGATNMVNGRNARYNKMAKGDYIAAAFINFFNSKDSTTTTKHHTIEFANYFMRIPSDAQNNFTVRMPKYRIAERDTWRNDGLFKFNAQSLSAAKKTISNKISAIPTFDLEDSDYNQLRAVDATLQDLVRDITSETLSNRRIFDNQIQEKNAKNGDIVHVLYSYTNSFGDIYYYVVEGILEIKDGTYYLNKPKFKEWSNTLISSEINNALTNKFLSKEIKNSNITRELNTEHPVYKQLEQIFLQELTDAGNTLSNFFKLNENHIPIINQETGEIEFDNGFDNTLASANTTFEGYHHEKKKPILEKIGNQYKLTGNVFKSNKFVLTVTKPDGSVENVNYGQDILDEAFDILYGGANDKYIHLKAVDGGYKAYLTDAQREIFNKHITEFLNNYIADFGTRLEDFSDFINNVDENLLNSTNIEEFAINYLVTYVAFDDLFEGSSKFYKDAQTILKRAKESQASGNPYGIVDYNQDFTAPKVQLNSRLDNIVFTRKLENGTTENVELHLYNKFSAATIKNSNVYNKELNVETKNAEGKIVTKDGALTKALIKSIEDSGIPHKEAVEKGRKMAIGYHENCANDAQSYITFEEWIRRITANGELGRYEKLINAIYDETKPVDTETLQQFVQAQKNFYYDHYFNSRLKTFGPRQIKNAEFVLIPRFIKGTELEQVYNLMIENGIDQLNTEETSKAAKCNVLTLWNENGELTQENIDKFKKLVGNSKEEFNYNYLYRQQDIKQHLNTHAKASLQIMKKLIDNIDPTNEKLSKLKDRYFKLYNANIEESYQNLMTDLGISLDDNGNIVLTDEGKLKDFNATKLLERAREEMARLGLNSNMLDYLTQVEDASSVNLLSQTIMPTYMSMTSSKLENIFQAIFNSKITRQKLAGLHAIQVSNIGFKQFDKENGQIQTSKELNYHPNGEPYIEIMLPRDAFNFDMSKFENLRKIEEAAGRDPQIAIDDLLIKELEAEGLDKILGYRIPTEGKQSVAIMKVKGFVDSTLGSTIILPESWVAQTGADFDIDSVYAFNFTHRRDKEGKVVKIRPEDPNDYKGMSKDARDNELLQTMMDIMSDPSTLEEAMSRSNFDDISDTLNRLYESNPNTKKRRNGRSSYNFLDQADFQEDAMSGVDLKAISVVRDNFCSVCNTVRPLLSTGNEIDIIYRKENGYTLENLRKSFGNDVKVIDAKKGIYKVTHRRFGWTENFRNSVGSLLTPYSSQTTAHSFDAMKNGSVPNVNTFTFQAYKMFPDVGADYSVGIAFIMQPAISEIVRIYNSVNSINSSKHLNAVQETIKNLKESIPEGTDVSDIVEKLFGVKDVDYSRLPLDRQLLEHRLNGVEEFDSSPVGEINKIVFDYIVANQYDKIATTGNAISNLARVCNPDKFGAKQSIYETSRTFETIREIINNISVLTVEGTTFLESIYPGISNGLQSYVSSQSEKESKYPFLNEFLKRVSATSIYVNKQMFLTQQDYFVELVKSIRDTFSNGRTTLSEKTYNSFKNFILNKYYTTVPIIENPITWKNGEFAQTDSYVGDIVEERRRIFGYDKTPDFRIPYTVAITDEKGNVIDTIDYKEFTVKDIENPTAEEINDYIKLSPAQKVAWIKANFTDGGIFNHIKASLFNNSNSRRNKIGSQSIEYNENNIDIEEAFHEFEKCFYNDNPLISLAALDLVKYAFVVEGYNMRKNGISKIITNSVLLDETSPFATNFVSNVNNSVAGISYNATDSDFIEEQKENYIRSHSNMQEIRAYWVKKKNKRFELGTTQNGMIFFSKDDTEFAAKYGIIYKDDYNQYELNNYVVLRFGKKNTLYKIEHLYDGNILLYPLNLLEENENTKWSANTENNRFPAKEYYLDIINQYNNSNDKTISLYSLDKENNEKAIAARAKNVKTISSKYARTFDINTTTGDYVGGFGIVKRDVRDHFADPMVISPLYVRSIALANYIKYPDTTENYGSKQFIDGKQYYISKVSTKKYNEMYLKQGKLVKNIDPQIHAIFEKATSEVQNLFKIEPVETVVPEDEQIMQSTVDELMPSAVNLNITAIEHMRRKQASEGNIHAVDAIAKLNDKEITSKKENVEHNLEESTNIVSLYVSQTVQEIEDNLNYFIKDEKGEYLAINDPKLIDLIRNNPAEIKRLLKTILDARAFVKQFNMINELNVDSEDPAIHTNLNRIKKNINSLSTNHILTSAEINFANNYLAKLSDDPRYREDMLNVLDGYYSTSGLEAWINDLQETTNPFLQVLTKTVMSDIRTKEMLNEKRIIEVKKKIEDIKRKAKENGYSVNFDHIIDKNGKFITSYNEQFVAKLDSLRNEVNETKVNAIDGTIEQTLDYLRKKLAYDKFKAAHVHQALPQEYYDEKITIEEKILTNFPTAYAAYQQLILKRNNLFSYIKNEQLEPSKREEYQKIQDAINNLEEEVFFDEDNQEYIPKAYVGEPSPFTGELAKIYSLDAAHAISNYRHDMSLLRGEYFENDTVFGFEEELEKNLAIINRYEERDGNGNLKRSIEELETIEEYQKAKRWIEFNARYEIDEDTQAFINEAYAKLKHKDNVSKRGSITNEVVKRLAKKHDAYDTHGIIDARKFSEEEIDAIRKEMYRDYNYRENHPFSDRLLISNAPTDTTIFTNEFYRKMTGDGASNAAYTAKVEEINAILRNYFDPATRKVRTYEMSEEDINKLVKLYGELDETKKRHKGSNGKSVFKFIENHVEFVTDDLEFELQKDLATQKGGAYYKVWLRLNMENDGSPNKHLFGYAKPKGYKSDGTGDNTYVDKKRTEAFDVIRNYTVKDNTEYYYAKYREMRAKSDAEFKAWYDANHVFDPYAHTMRPLSCWVRTKILPVADDGNFEVKGTYIPSFAQTTQKVKEGMENPNHIKDGSLAANFNANQTSKYKENESYINTENNLNPYEEEIKELFQDVIRSYATVDSAKRFINKGYMPARTKSPETSAKTIAKEVIKFFGWINNSTGKETWYDTVDYSTDSVEQMPMLEILKSKDSKKLEINKPERKDYESDSEYQEALNKYNEEKAKIDAENLKIHSTLIDRNFEEVLEDFMRKAGKYNSIQENKYMLFYGQEMINKLNTYQQSLGRNTFKKKGRDTNKSERTYVRKPDQQLIQQYENWIRRFIYDQWKEPNAKLTQAANVLQSITSSKFMMLNVTGGIANVNVGEVSVFAEAAVQEYFGVKQWAKGLEFWSQGIPSYFADAYSDKATSLANAIIKFMNVVDYDENTGIVSNPNAAEYIKRVRDAMFITLQSGEHMMQNGAMFSMMESHRLFENIDKKNNGKTTYVLKNKAEYIRDNVESLFESMLTDSQKEEWKTFKANELSTPDKKKDYIWFAKDLTTQFINFKFTKEQKQEYITKRNELESKLEKEFENDERHPTLMSQLKLGENGKLTFKDGSILANLGDEAYNILGAFKGRVISVNKKIHGIYDKMGAAQLEKKFYGSLVMQYHKHIYPGMMKRFRRKGYFNEERGTIEKGTFASLKHFASLPLDNIKFQKELQNETGMTDQQMDVLKGISNITKAYLDFAINIKLNFHTLPKYEQANILRAIANLSGVVAALCTVIALQCIGDDDDEHGFMYNLAMYEADRLASESFMYNPLGFISEAEKLWSSPIAAQNGIEAITSGLGLVWNYIIQGEDFDPTYETGLYAGEDKMSILIKRQIPIYHSIFMLERLDKSNKYYKLGKNMLSVIPTEAIGDWISGDK